MTLAQAARKQMRADGGSYRRDHLRLLAQRVEVADKEVRIMGSKSNLLRTLAAISNPQTSEVAAVTHG
jgi:site-specific DNA recombinase